MDIRQSPQHAQFLRLQGWKVEHVHVEDGSVIQVYIRPILHIFNFYFFSAMKIQRFRSIPDLKELRGLMKKWGVRYLCVEPAEDVEKNALLKFVKRLGLRQSKFGYICTKTLRIDLTQTESSLLEDLRENPKRILSKPMRSGYETVMINGAEFLARKKEFDAFEAKGIQDGKFWWFNQKQFQALVGGYGDKLDLAITRNTATGEMHSGILLLSSDDAIYYFRAFGDEVSRKHRLHTWTVWKSFLYAKKLGRKTYDFDGILDDRFPIKSWRGFTEFKLRFGGATV